MAAKAVFLDRDGVLTRAVIRQGIPFAPVSLEEMEILPGAVEAVESLRKAGFLTIVVTNQPDVARGKMKREAVEAMHKKLRGLLALNDIFVCCHDDGDGCKCRKPQPGMLNDAAERFGIDLSASFLIGDRWKDAAAGKAAGCASIWIDFGYDEPPAEAADFIVSSLGEAVAVILKNPR
ncbi:MAG: D,D-heptose 1,7-bisphosphate phosphatase [Rhodospirillales bacterium RIFCSPLOWO2_12_FULL_58_28]|nr:MAG: D,D-heptose 1,7-bisphosphate phosphatase [Rhodospirillales bacterium RIFCSPLOWO2_02_FULL_58_16]OHC79326.1 MAG: D,D-heptose 1,7-bisphosphate phosphatase [Rhodospirillales bacterium RIFCSPLOWO2_12_FULL_58_28]